MRATAGFIRLAEEQTTAKTEADPYGMTNKRTGNGYAAMQQGGDGSWATSPLGLAYVAPVEAVGDDL